MDDDVLEQWQALEDSHIYSMVTLGCMCQKLADALVASRAECEALRQQIRMLEAQDDDDEVRRRLRQYEGTEIDLAEARAECEALRGDADKWQLLQSLFVRAMKWQIEDTPLKWVSLTLDEGYWSIAAGVGEEMQWYSDVACDQAEGAAGALDALRAALGEEAEDE